MGGQRAYELEQYTRHSLFSTRVDRSAAKKTKARDRFDRKPHDPRATILSIAAAAAGEHREDLVLILQ